MFSFRQGHASIFVPPPVVGPKHLRPFSPSSQVRQNSRCIQELYVAPSVQTFKFRPADSRTDTSLSDSCRTGSSRADSLWPSRVTQSPYRRPSSSPRFLKRTNSFRVESSRSKNKTRSIRRPDCLLSTAYQRPTSNCCAFHQDATCRIIARLIKPHKIHSNYLLPAGCISRQPINNHCARFPSSFGTTEVFIYTPRVPFKLTPHKLLSKHFSFVGQHHFYMYMYMQAK